MTYRPYDSLVISNVGDSYINNSGVSVQKATPLRATLTKNVDFIDVSVESQVRAIIGVSTDDISDGSSGYVIGTGRVKNISIDAVFGDDIYVSKTGGLTNVHPEAGVGGFVEGDYAIRIGVIAHNESDSGLKDLLLNITIIGQI